MPDSCVISAVLRFSRGIKICTKKLAGENIINMILTLIVGCSNGYCRAATEYYYTEDHSKYRGPTIVTKNR